VEIEGPRSTRTHRNGKSSQNFFGLDSIVRGPLAAFGSKGTEPGRIHLEKETKMYTRQKRIIWGRIAPKSQKTPANMNDLITQAMAEHLKEHADDGMSLFVVATLSSMGCNLHIYPISAVDADTAFQIARGLHEQRGLPPSREWCLIFPYGDADQRNPLIQ